MSYSLINYMIQTMLLIIWCVSEVCFKWFIQSYTGDEHLKLLASNF